MDGPTSDVKFEAYGESLEDVFENAAYAMMSIMCDVKVIRPERAIEINVEGRDDKDLLFSWLQELIAMVDVENMFFGDFDVSMSDNKLTATVRGERTCPEKSGTHVKAVTYHDFSLEQKDGKWVARVVCDI